MGNNLPSCSCIKNNNEEKLAEFKPESINTNFNKGNLNVLLSSESREPSIVPSQPKKIWILN